MRKSETRGGWNRQGSEGVEGGRGESVVLLVVVPVVAEAIRIVWPFPFSLQTYTKTSSAARETIPADSLSDPVTR